MRTRSVLANDVNSLLYHVRERCFFKPIGRLGAAGRAGCVRRAGADLRHRGEYRRHRHGDGDLDAGGAGGRAVSDPVRRRAGSIIKPTGTVSFQISGSGSYESIKNFLMGLETNIRIFDVNSISLSARRDPGHKDPGGESGHVQLHHDGRNLLSSPINKKYHGDHC